jgi:hypothetical protein
MEDGCTCSCIFAARLVVFSLEWVCGPPPDEPQSALACLDEFASTARKVMPDGLTGTRAAVIAGEVVVDGDAIRTPDLLHVVCQDFPFAWPTAAGGNY